MDTYKQRQLDIRSGEAMDRQRRTPINQHLALDEPPGLSEEASTLGFNSMYPLFKEVLTKGVWVRRRNGQLAPFFHTHTQRDGDGDIQVWTFAYAGEVLTIFND